MLRSALPQPAFGCTVVCFSTNQFFSTELVSPPHPLYGIPPLPFITCRAGVAGQGAARLWARLCHGSPPQHRPSRVWAGPGVLGCWGRVPGGYHVRPAGWVGHGPALPTGVQGKVLRRPGVCIRRPVSLKIGYEIQIQICMATPRAVLKDPDFFLLRTAPRDSNPHHRPTAANRQLPTVEVEEVP